MRICLLLVLAGCCEAAVSQPQDAKAIVRRSVQMVEADWNRAPEFSYLERDVESKRSSKPAIRTYQVFMIEGSPYRRLVRTDDRPLSPGDQAEEDRKMRREIVRRQHESDRDRRNRIGKFEKERRHDHAMLLNMVEAFDFHLSGEQLVNGHECWVFKALPKPGYQPKDRETRVLAGMRGTLWIDKQQYQWVRVKAEVFKPVSFYGFLAKVGPGTHFFLEQAPVEGDLWLPQKFDVQVNATALGFIDESSTDNETYTDYRANPKVSALLTHP